MSDEFGFCRRYPPQVVVTRSGEDDEIESRWPLVDDDDWCGMFYPNRRTGVPDAKV
jgi:hypothetical protein